MRGGEEEEGEEGHNMSGQKNGPERREARKREV